MTTGHVIRAVPSRSTWEESCAGWDQRSAINILTPLLDKVR